MHYIQQGLKLSMTILICLYFEYDVHFTNYALITGYFSFFKGHQWPNPKIYNHNKCSS